MLPPISQNIQVNFKYNIIFTEGLFKADNSLLLNTLNPSSGSCETKILCVVDNGLLDANPGLFKEINQYFDGQPSLQCVQPPLVVPGGEKVKNHTQYVEAIQELIHRHKIDRHSYILAIGGGAVIDMVGYAAAVSHRGVRLIRIPTTVLSQNDSAVGVKNGINAYGKKNFLGTFAPPYAVLIDFDFLTTLNDRDWISGTSEAVKVALLKDPDFFHFLEDHSGRLQGRDMPSMQKLIYRCAELHLDHIANSGDPFEAGTSRPLDFGHWAAHKIEQLSNYKIRHGEAVAVGLALDVTYAYYSNILSKNDWIRILELLRQLGFKLFVPELTINLDEPGKHPSILEGLNEFREHLGGQLTIMLIKGIGESFETHTMDEKRILKSIKALREYELSTTVNR
ncbi:MAG: 3-dehydroquinate synthase [Balneolales bacterium]